MFKEILIRMIQGKRTFKYPKGPAPVLPGKFKGRPYIDSALCDVNCNSCSDACPVDAINSQTKTIDLGNCLFCNDCTDACHSKAIVFTKDYRLSVRDRNDLIIHPEQKEIELAKELNQQMKRIFGRSLTLRQVSAGGCGACEADVNVLGTIGWDLGRFGIKFAASPRHADGLLVTGPVTKNMELALKKTYDAIPEPKIVIVVGACAISGGLYKDHPQANKGVESIIPVDLFIPGCPPNPLTILDGLLRLLGRV
ncbi:MAG: hydrogenase [Spirochaetes bacterium GWF1_31_7]|nr:MAG: hydrogenase [Spirochaetes bacterium GWE1_32_154]OHD46115.1 MAG: hydrogenase [Spirochaetes bacterium GWE2_31_10]OHD47514.1 MAG: hydrogenase [Spirochaetes bacterium GWF1_31_7]OHD83231.1 MAG: hydrogenase [Spirochaetes bacterium RIFOXYB1_FULL_32_8]